ncbi:fused MFS/spermidine synthase [Paraburkholderia pallida]|uniref:Spermidine synthase n=1 Tax=Paraburkholderia pallida TaxID=2547399 RepID=A0A4P7D663_9BURK|nr:fused MFS/spermidine synthase [Paraburkholderia pallida]QBR04209.1 spermidine synthase [Paraburkholderia pallida]
MPSWKNPAFPSGQDVLDAFFPELPRRHLDVPVVREGLRTRSLCFGVLDVQTAMCKSDPLALQLPYTRAMMAFELFQPAPSHILVVGLGGGSLSKYCHCRFPRAVVTTIEIDERVIALRRQFHIPADSARFRVIHADAAAHLAELHNDADVILLDGFDAFGLPANLASHAFYDACHAALRENGVLVANLLERGSRAAACLERIGYAFGQRPFCTHAVRGGNPVAMVVKTASAPDWPALHARARDIALRGGLEYHAHVKNMERNDSGRPARNAVACVVHGT